jgi:D-glycero-alpha-D-manno-heptose 1-phosphate guanylyltransferase
MEIIILAGGKGTRLKKLVNDRPKPLADVNGKPFIEIIMDNLIQQGACHFILATGFMSSMFRSHFGDSYRGVPISFSEESRPLGTGGAIIKAQMMLRGEGYFFIMNGDTFFPIKLERLKNFALRNRSDIAIALCQANESGRYGAATLGTKSEIQLEKTTALKGELANGGICVVSRQLEPNLVDNSIPVSFERDLLPAVKKNGGKLTGMIFSDYFIDVGTPQDYVKFCSSFGQDSTPANHNE